MQTAKTLFVLGLLLLNVTTESRKKEKAEKEKKSAREKKFLQLTEKYLNCDVHNAHICYAFTIANPRIAFAAYTCD